MAYKRSRLAFEADLRKQESPYVFYGTSLPPLDERVRDDGSFVPIWKQEVTDDRGRKRLHGAFTGGFSAGYYNSVGSKEGWTPSTFVSSRQNRAKDAKGNKPQRPEDYMDEEDLQAAEEARQLQTAGGYAGFGTEHDQRHKSSIMDIFHPVEETAGVKLLKRMGWKDGQGIGPQIKRAANLGDNIRESDEVHSFAPEDVPMLSFDRKNDHQGLGYGGAHSYSSGTQKQSSSTGREIAHSQSDEDISSAGPVLGPRKPTMTKKKGAFGYGVLNDTGSDDDDDPYSMGPRISYNKTIGGDKRSTKKSPVQSSNANPSVRTKPILLSKKLASIRNTLRKCHDGRLPLDGFVLGNDLDGMATLSLKADKYKPPAVPSDWKSSFANDQETTTSEPLTSITDAGKSSSLDAKSRASILGEASLPGKSVFDFLTPAARDRLATASGKSNLPPGRGENPSSPSDAQVSSLAAIIPQLPPDIALQALTRAQSGWTPYSADPDPAKQSRYKTFLEIRAGLHPTPTGDPLPPRAPNTSQADYLLELQEFTRAAEVFRPITGLMANRFTSSTISAPQSDLGEAATTSSSTPNLLSHPTPKPTNPAEEAARLGMFGHLTRSVINFYPTRLLCKRFDVPMPTPTSAPESVPSTAPPPETNGSGIIPNFSNRPTTTKFQSAGFQTNEKDPVIDIATPAPALAPAPSQGNSDIPVKSPSEPVEIDTDRNEALEQERPGQALFKAIFGSDDDEDDDD